MHLFLLNLLAADKSRIQNDICPPVQIIYFALIISLQCIPFVHVLMSKKSEIAYTHVFKYIDENVFSLDCSSLILKRQCAKE